MFGNKKTTQPKDSVLPAVESEKIHTMPGRFQVSAPKKGNKIFFILIILMIIFIVVLTGLAIAYKNNWFSQPRTANNANTARNVNIAVNSETNANANININVNINSEPSPPLSPYDVSDIDVDGLTGEEEKTFSTNANNPDTDSDGYKDEEEILYGFDPRWKDKLLEDADIVTKFNFHDAVLLYPVQWYVKETGPVAIFDTKTGETIGLSYTGFDKNMNKQNLLEWIKKDDPMLSVSDIEETSTRSMKVVYKTKDGMKYYIFSNDFKNAYALSYKPIDTETQLFFSVFQMMVNSFKIM